MDHFTFVVFTLIYLIVWEILFISDNYFGNICGTKFLQLYFYLFFHFTEFNIFAEIVRRNSKMRLLLDGHLYVKTNSHLERTYWRCIEHKRSKCPSRLSSKIINGYIMAKVNSGFHSHLKPVLELCFWIMFRV